MPVDDLARDEVITADPSTPVAEIARTMDEQGVGSVVVVRETAPVGIVTDRDLTVRIIAAEREHAELTAADVMTEDLCTIEWNGGFYEATELMREHGIRRLPVCRDGELTGIITADDLFELLADEKQQLAAVIRAQRPEY